jgi:acyl-CoA thioesterase
VSDEATALARRVGEHLSKADAAMRLLGIALVDIVPGRATLRMAVRPDMLNAWGTGHGGLTATLADSAFAFAASSTDQASVASGFSIDLLAPVREGDVLDAECRCVQQGRRAGLYDVEVRNQRGEAVALFRGRSQVMRDRRVLEGAAA